MRIAESLSKMKLQPFATEADVEEALRLFQVSTLDAALSGTLSGEQMQGTWSRLLWVPWLRALWAGLWHAGGLQCVSCFSEFLFAIRPLSFLPTAVSSKMGRSSFSPDP